MPNLLPEKNKKENCQQFFYRKLAVLMIVIAILIFIACVFLASVYIYFSLGGSVGKEEGKSLVELSSADQSLVKETQGLNQKLEILLPAEDAALPSSVAISVVDGKEEGINIHHLALECQGQTKTCVVAVLGQAGDRQSLLDYVADLRQNKLFKSVESPVNNLISDKDSQFSLELETNTIKDLLD